MYEWQKGELGFWWPFLDSLPCEAFFDSWRSEVLPQTQDLSLISEAIYLKKTVQKYWEDL
jgi:hypothetical protein